MQQTNTKSLTDSSQKSKVRDSTQERNKLSKKTIDSNTIYNQQNTPLMSKPGSIEKIQNKANQTASNLVSKGN